MTKARLSFHASVMIEINANSGRHNNVIVILPIQAQCMLLL